MFYYLIEKHMQKFKHFLRKKIYPKKSLVSILHQAIQYCFMMIILFYKNDYSL